MIHRVLRCCVAAVAWFAIAATTCAAAPFSFDTTPGRLPKDVVPRAYRIAIVPDRALRTFLGSERIDVVVRRATRTIVLDAVNLTVRDVRFDGTPVAAVATDRNAGLLRIALARPAAAGAHVLALAYAGRIETEPRGLFVQHYTHPDGTPAVMLATQFESIDARRMIPSFDEPAFRARFALTVTLPARWAVVGNMPVAARVVRGALATTTFAPTSPMASYLLELSAGDLGVRRASLGRTRLGVWAPREDVPDAGYALARARDILADHDAYFGIPYPLPKLDAIAIPGGFPGAMENWGAITYDRALLIARPSSTLDDRQQIFSTLSHEMAHQWTGDLVTMAWWDDIWLNESFASWRAAAETDARNPGWHWWENQDGDKELAMRADASRFTHPIAQKVTDERLADAVFDGPITYSKGQAFLRMLEAYVTPARFRAGIRTYLRAHADGNATSDDLWNALAAAGATEAPSFARAWTTRPGFPLVTVRATCDALGVRTLALAQERFLLAGGPASATWPIPLQVRSGTAPVVRVLLREPRPIVAGRCDEPLSVNADGVGFYRVAYDDATLAVDTRALAALAPGDAIALLDDQWALALAGRAPLAAYLRLASTLNTTAGVRAWTQALGALEEIARRERGTPGEAAYLRFARSVVAPLAARLGWERAATDRPGDDALRAAVLTDLGTWGDPATIDAARERFARLRTAPATVPDPLRDTVLTVVAVHADAATFAQLRAAARTWGAARDRAHVYAALAHVRDPALAHAALALFLSDAVPAELADQRLDWVLQLGDVLPDAVWSALRTHVAVLVAPLAATAPETLATIVPERLWRGVSLDAIAAWLDRVAPTERTLVTPRALERARVDRARTPALLASADAYVAGARSGTSALMSSSSGIASRNAPTIRGSKPKPDSFSICSTAMLTDAASRHGRRDVSAENVSATATTRAKSGIASPCSPDG